MTVRLPRFGYEVEIFTLRICRYVPRIWALEGPRLEKMVLGQRTNSSFSAIAEIVTFIETQRRGRILL